MIPTSIEDLETIAMHGRALEAHACGLVAKLYGSLVEMAEEASPLTGGDTTLFVVDTEKETRITAMARSDALGLECAGKHLRGVLGEPPGPRAVWVVCVSQDFRNEVVCLRLTYGFLSKGGQA